MSKTNYTKYMQNIRKKLTLKEVSKTTKKVNETKELITNPKKTKKISTHMEDIVVMYNKDKRSILEKKGPFQESESRKTYEKEI